MDRQFELLQGYESEPDDTIPENDAMFDALVVGDKTDLDRLVTRKSSYLALFGFGSFEDRVHHRVDTILESTTRPNLHAAATVFNLARVELNDQSAIPGRNLPRVNERFRQSRHFDPRKAH